MKITLKVFGLLFVVILTTTIFVLITMYYITGIDDVYKPNDASNYDGKYNVPISNDLCADLGFSFKLLHQRSQGVDTSDYFFSNCHMNSYNEFSGYIYPKDSPSQRVFWEQFDGGVDYALPEK